MWRLPFDLNFPISFRLTASPNAFIVDVVPRDNSSILNWSFDFRRGRNDREEDELQSLLQVMNPSHQTPLFQMVEFGCLILPAFHANPSLIP